MLVPRAIAAIVPRHNANSRPLTCMARPLINFKEPCDTGLPLTKKDFSIPLVTLPELPAQTRCSVSVFNVTQPPVNLHRY